MRDAMSNQSQHIEGNEHGKASVALLILLIVVLLGGLCYGIYQWQHDKVSSLERRVTQLSGQLTDAQKQGQKTATNTTQQYTSPKGIKVTIYTPVKGEKISSPLVVLGEVPGNWSFEGNFPVIIKNSEGTTIAQSPAQLLSDWMTASSVPFSVKLTFDSPVTGDGVLELKKDNPSDLAENNDNISIPISFD